ncbi:MAG: hypothetical protein ACK46X_11630 [Candidatus Sericytochromatia bacterium]
MRWLPTRWIVAAAALIASGCLLPQPDTPWVPPGAAGPMAEGARPGDATMTAPVAAPEATATPDPGPSARVWVQISGRVIGIEATDISAVAESGWKATHTFGADGTFVMAVPYGRYWLELSTASGRLRVEPPIVLNTPDERRITLTIEGGRVTLEEEARFTPATPEPRVSPGPTAPPSPSPSPGGGNTATAVVQ